MYRLGPERHCFTLVSPCFSPGNPDNTLDQGLESSFTVAFSAAHCLPVWPPGCVSIGTSFHNTRLLTDRQTKLSNCGHFGHPTFAHQPALPNELEHLAQFFQYVGYCGANNGKGRCEGESAGWC